MSKTKSNIPKSKRGGYDFWSRRSLGTCLGPGRVGKWITRMRDRMRNKRIERMAISDPENTEGRFPGE